jgi:hypothetical protein
MEDIRKEATERLISAPSCISSEVAVAEEVEPIIMSVAASAYESTFSDESDGESVASTSEEPGGQVRKARLYHYLLEAIPEIRVGPVLLALDPVNEIYNTVLYSSVLEGPPSIDEQENFNFFSSWVSKTSSILFEK